MPKCCISCLIIKKTLQSNSPSRVQYSGRWENYVSMCSNKFSEIGTIGKSPGVHRLSASLHDLSVTAVTDEGAVAAPNNGPDYDQYSPSGASTMGRRGVSAFGNGGVKSHAALCKSVSQVSSTDSTRTEEDDTTTTVSSSSGGSSGSLATALQTEIRRRAAEKSAPGTFGGFLTKRFWWIPNPPTHSPFPRFSA